MENQEASEEWVLKKVLLCTVSSEAKRYPEVCWFLAIQRLLVILD